MSTLEAAAGMAHSCFFSLDNFKTLINIQLFN